MRTHSSILGIAVLAGTLMLGASANAQGYGYGSYENASYQAPNENVDVTVPRYNPQRDRYGAPYREISMSQNVYFGDLNLRTRHGERVLKSRISQSARTMCRKLDARYPITAPNSPGCYTTAMNDALQQADDAIADARGYGRY